MRAEFDARCTLHGRTSAILGHHRPPHVLQLVADVAFGSIASFRPDTDHFRSSPISSHFQSWLACLKGAITGLMHRSKMHYSITWSARSRKASEIVKPSAFAVFRLMISSNLVGRSTGSSPGRLPLRILSVNAAARR